MARAEVGSIKWLSNKMKAKGLQRLKWYCQMCEKQCRDENGFKCHMLSESHARQMQVFAQRPGKFMDDFSRSFEADFMRFMRTRYCRTRVLANTVYCELISNKTHIHMNATVWTTLSEFVRYLGNTGKCEVEKTPRGWYLTYIDQEKLAREKMAAAGIKQYASAEALEEKRFREAYQAAQESFALQQSHAKSDTSTPAITSTDRPQIKMNLKGVVEPSVKVQQSAPATTTRVAKRDLSQVFDSYVERSGTSARSSKNSRILDELVTKKMKHSSAPPQEETDEDKEFPPHPLEDSDMWLSENLLVRVTKPGWEFDQAKGTVAEIRQDAATSGGHRIHAIMRLRTKQKLKLDLQFLETVIPRRGRWARVVMGVYRGFEGRVLAADTDTETISIALFFGALWGDVADDMQSDTAALVPPGQRKDYELRVKAKQSDPSVLERGELVIHQMPFDSICRVSPPAEFDEMDEAFPDDDNEDAGGKGDELSPPQQ